MIIIFFAEYPNIASDKKDYRFQPEANLYFAEQWWETHKNSSKMANQQIPTDF